jgi:hypothetical protein
MVFELNPDLLRDLPPVVGAILEEFVAALDQAMGPQLESVILFGSAAEGRLRATSDVNLYEYERAARRGGRSRWTPSIIWRLLWPARKRAI